MAEEIWVVCEKSKDGWIPSENVEWPIVPESQKDLPMWEENGLRVRRFVSEDACNELIGHVRADSSYPASA